MRIRCLLYVFITLINKSHSDVEPMLKISFSWTLVFFCEFQELSSRTAVQINKSKKPPSRNSGQDFTGTPQKTTHPIRPAGNI